MDNLPGFATSAALPRGHRLAMASVWAGVLCLLAGCTGGTFPFSKALAAKDAEAIAPIELGTLDEEIPLQYMAVVSLDLSLFSIAYTDPVVGGDLRSVRVAPPESPDAYLWGRDFSGSVDRRDGTVELTFLRDGEYIVKTVRESPVGVQTEEYMQILYNSACGGNR